ncbi:DUF11 domain-containing protein [Parasphingorhabdus halotolerans]|uniref:DUF11 domain-containing protein n=2 Tax=Parasphingorhabdus halotolerans TaxID=2725558 RepID=A0A6H2DRM7_9SPHN|nr:DUF11 domain-containing protein [Parasphingorhabdus halotolerans]
MTQLGISGTFDVNSVRVVRPNGTLATIQEYTDGIFNDATDAANNNRGEIKWIVQDGGTQTYYIYFDITQNGAKTANPQTPINANFERGTTGQVNPTGWSGTAVTNYDAQVRPNETVSVADNTTVNTNGNANTGSFSYLIGSRTNADSNGTDRAVLTRTIAVPATNPGNLTVRWKPQGWDSSANSATQWDYLRIEIVGGTTTEIVGPTAGNYVMRPFSPNFGTSAANTGRSGYGPYNGWDMTTTGVHTAGMTVANGSEPWWSHSASLAAYAGQTVTVRFSSNHAASFRSWFMIDDMEWSIVNGTLGTPEGFGVVTTLPANASTLAPGQSLTITAQVDARPTAATNPVTANVYNQAGTLVGSNILLYNDGTHGDVTAGDAIWTNNNSVPAQPTYTIPLGTATTTGWIVRVFAKDASASTIGAQNGLVHRNGLPIPEIEANYWNIDEITFNVTRANISVTKISRVLSDPVNGVTNPKAIPGATLQYCILITNGAGATATAITATDTLPSDVTYVTGSMTSGANCSALTYAEDEDASGADESDPYGASISGSVITANAVSLAPSSAFALVFRVTID